jgi:hypothetical protein
MERFRWRAEDRPDQPPHARSTRSIAASAFRVYFDKLGQENSTIARLHYAYHFKFGRPKNLQVSASMPA